MDLELFYDLIVNHDYAINFKTSFEIRTCFDLCKAADIEVYDEENTDPYSWPVKGYHNNHLVGLGARLVEQKTVITWPEMEHMIDSSGIETESEIDFGDLM